MSAEQTTRMSSGRGFIAALDQSGGSTPKALRLYGIPDDQYSTEAEMFDLVHAMRTRIITNPAFTSDKILGTILFEQTVDREIAGRPSAEYVWQERGILPILKVDKGLEPPETGVQLMKPIPDLDATLRHALDKGVFGTKMRSVIREDNEAGIDAIVAQQFDIAGRIAAAGLVPIIEPEVDIHCPGKPDAEEMMLRAITQHLGLWPADRPLMFKLTIPSVDDFFAELIAHPKVVRVVALSGGYSRDEACERLARNHGLIASFSRALTEGLSVHQTDDEFTAALAASIDQIYQASMT
ncbi:MAG: fructose bisphosphate aldolase [Propionibacterium sp.]|nr:fructose bisphosphate aldolase [Propionibacterium sp.]